MPKTLLSQYSRQNLKDLIDLLKKDYYEIITVSCNHIHNLANNMEQATETTANNYISMCARLAEDIRNDIHMSEVIIPPYVYELHEKTSSSHDCATCSGKCHLNHSLQMKGIQAAHEKVREQLQRIGQMAQQEEDQSETPPVKLLRNEINCLDTILAELLFLEEAILIPKIQEAQTAINAAG